MQRIKQEISLDSRRDSRLDSREFVWGLESRQDFGRDFEADSRLGLESRRDSHSGLASLLESGQRVKASLDSSFKASPCAISPCGIRIASALLALLPACYARITRAKALQIARIPRLDSGARPASSPNFCALSGGSYA